MRKRFITILAVASFAILGAPSPSQAYCDPTYYETTGRCTNSCIESARLYKKVTGRDAPWMCPM